MFLVDVIVVVLQVNEGCGAGATVLGLRGSGACNLGCGRHSVIGSGQASKVLSVGSIKRRSCTLAPKGG